MPYFFFFYFSYHSYHINYNIKLRRNSIINIIYKMKKTQTKSFTPLPTLLLDQLRNQDPKKRLNSVIHLRVIVSALGPDRSRNQLLPFLNQFVDDSEQILITLINSLKQISPLLGGQIHQKTLLPLLTLFCKSDQKNVSALAIDFMKTILKKINIKANEDFIMDTIKKLVQSDSLNGKQAGIALIVSLIKDLNTVQLLEIYNSYCNDNYCQVRKIGAKYLKDLILNIKQNIPILSQIVSILINDRQDLIKIISFEGALQYFPYNQALVLEFIKTLLQINSWRINLKICQSMILIVKQLNKTQFKTYLQKQYLNFFNSQQSQLRAAAFNCLQLVCSSMTEADIINSVYPIIQKISKDSKPYVRIQLAKHFLSIVKFVPKQSLNEVILPLLSLFLKDCDPQISLSVFSSLSHLSDSISANQLQQNTLTCINQLFSSNKWRTKCQAIDIMNQLVKHKNFINDKMINMIISWTFDKIDAVRIKAIGLIEQLFKIYGGGWAQGKLIPKITTIQSSPNYLQRQLILIIIQKVLKYCSIQIINCYFYPILLVMSKDKVPNIRYLVVKIIKNNASILSSIKYKSIVEMMIEDKDSQIKIQAKSILI